MSSRTASPFVARVAPLSAAACAAALTLSACGGAQVSASTADDPAEAAPLVSVALPTAEIAAKAQARPAKVADSPAAAMAGALSATPPMARPAMSGAVSNPLIGGVDVAQPAAASGTPAVPAGVARHFASLGMNFAAPAGLRAVPTARNPDMHYEFAAERPGIQVRYAGDEMPGKVPPQSVAFMVAFNIADGEEAILDDQEFPAAAVKNDYGADWGKLVLLRPRATFAKGYQLCLLQILNKGNRFAYSFVLFNPGNKEVADQAPKLLQALQFKR
ncbi:MAG: hypothetical protein HY902_01480 [Deltaproteobacteria bacterium]|nr:hypothetical protein [Deltaproteobacteria bacterium]